MDCTTGDVLNQSIPYSPEFVTSHFPRPQPCPVAGSDPPGSAPGSASSTTWTRDQKRQCRSRTNAPPWAGDQRRCWVGLGALGGRVG